MLTDGTLLQGRYRVVRKLASGGMGTVYEATDERLDATVALKETAFEDEELRGQFEREARLLARLSHSALPRVSDHFAEGSGAFLVMQFVEGEDLETLRRREEGGAFPVERVLAWADELLDALEYLHTRQPPVIHRDIKPQNLKLGARGRVILLDFGLAKGYASRTSPHAPAPSIHGGTPAYAPLEQLEGTGTDARSDLFSLAVTLYQLMTGVLPSAVMTRLNALHNNQPDPLRPAHEVNPRVPREVSAVLQDAMSVARDERPASAAEMRCRLQKAGRQQESSGTAPTIPMMSTVLDDDDAQDAATDEPPFDSEGATQDDFANLTSTQRHHLEYWTAFRDYMERRGSFIAPTKPQPYHLMIFPVGRSDFGLEVFNMTRPNSMGIRLVLKGIEAKRHFHLLSREKKQIQKEIRSALEWEEKPSQKNSVIYVIRRDVYPTDRRDWPRQHSWLLENLEDFYQTFVPRIGNLRAGDYAPVAEKVSLATESVEAAAAPEEEKTVASSGAERPAAPRMPTRGRGLRRLAAPLGLLMTIAFTGWGFYVMFGGSRVKTSPPATAPTNSTAPVGTATPGNLTREQFEANMDYYARLATRESKDTVGSGVEDLWLWAKARAGLTVELGERASNVHVNVIGGALLLSGSVRDSSEATRVLDAMKKIEGVKSVSSSLRFLPTT